MNMKRFGAAAIVLFGFIFFYEWLVHGMLLSHIYQETASVWRSHDQMMAYLPYNFGFMAVIALWLTFIFTRFYHDGGVVNGLRFGFYIGVLSAIQAFSGFFYLPIPLMLGGFWFLASLVECMIGGLLIGAIYRK